MSYDVYVQSNYKEPPWEPPSAIEVYGSVNFTYNYQPVFENVLGIVSVRMFDGWKAKNVLPILYKFIVVLDRMGYDEVTQRILGNGTWGTKVTLIEALHKLTTLCEENAEAWLVVQ
jgi:hypothetical protein